MFQAATKVFEPYQIDQIKRQAIILKPLDLLKTYVS